MATTADAVLDLVKLFTSQKVNSTATDRETSTMTPEQLQAILQKSLESTSGLASVTGGQRTAGMYNSSVNQMLTNDLLARLAGEAQSRSMDKTSTRSISQVTPPAIDPMKGLMALGVGMAQKQGTEIGKKLLDQLFSGSGDFAITPTVEAIAPDVAANLGFDWFTNDAGGLMTGADYSTLLGDIASSTITDTAESSIFDTISGWFGW